MQFIKLSLAAWDGKSKDLWELTLAQRAIFFGLIAFAREHHPHGIINDGEHRGQPKPASMARLSKWCGASKSTIHKALKKMEKLDMVKRDGRKKHGCFEVVNWSKWQQNNRSGDERQGASVRETNDAACPNNPENEENRSGGERQRSGDERLRPGLLSEDDRSGDERGPQQNPEAPEETLHLFEEEGRSGAEQTSRARAREVQSTTKGSNKGASAKNTDADTSPKSIDERLQKTGLKSSFAKDLIRRFPTETDYQIVIRELWEALDFEGAPGGKGYSGLVKLCQEFGFPKLQRLASHFRQNKPRPPAGADGWAWFSKTVRRMLNRDFKWDEKENGGKTRSTGNVSPPEAFDDVELDENGRLINNG